MKNSTTDISNNKKMMVEERFELNQLFCDELQNKTAHFGFGGFGEATYYRTYSRIKSNGEQEHWADTVIRVTNGVMSVRKNHYVLNRLAWDEVFWQDYAQRIADAMFDMKWLPPGRGLWVMGTDYVYERGGAALNNPLHKDTKILTKEFGWVNIGSVENSKVTVLSNTKKYGEDNTTAANSVWVEANISNFEIQPTKKITYISKFGDKHSVIASDNHRWIRRKTSKHPWEKEVKSIELVVGDYLPRTKTPKYYKISWQGIQHGFFFGDGTRSNGELHTVLEKMEVLTTLFTNVETVGETKVVRQLPIAWGKIPSGEYNKDQRYVYGFLAGYFAADGSFSSTNIGRISSSRKEELIAVKLLFENLGIRTKAVRLTSTTSNYKEERELYELQFSINDVHADFFIKESHRINFDKIKNKIKNDWLEVVAIEDSKQHEVLCATVPGLEQFVIEGNALTGNCGAVDTTDLSKAADWTMDMLMSGVGVGFNTAWSGENASIPDKTDPIKFVIPDEREGWVASVRMLIESYTKGGSWFSFDYDTIRPEGSPINGFGGTASGSWPLEQLHERIESYLDLYCNNKQDETRTTADIINAIGACVVAGNVRRSAEISLGSVDDDTFLELKDYNKNPDRSEIGWMSNNTVVLEKSEDFQKLPIIAKRIRDNGEPGIMNLINVQKYARYGDESEDKAWLANPCSEIPLESFELCNLAEVFVARCDSEDEFYEALEFATFYASTVALLPTHREETNAIVVRNRRIGVSLSGVADILDALGATELTRRLRKGYKLVHSTNKKLSSEAGVPSSVRVTTVKPSGTISQLVGVSSGMHFPTFQYAIRRMRVGNSSHICDVLKEAGIPNEPDEYSANTTVFEFPIDQGKTRKATSVSAWEQFAFLAMLQREWSDNMVSCTVYFDPKTEGDQIEHMLAQFAPIIKSVSMLPHTDTGAYVQMPYEGITKEVYEKRVASLPKIDWSNFGGSDGIESRFCTNDSCDIST